MQDLATGDMIPSTSEAQVDKDEASHITRDALEQYRNDMLDTNPLDEGQRTRRVEMIEKALTALEAQGVGRISQAGRVAHCSKGGRLVSAHVTGRLAGQPCVVTHSQVLQPKHRVTTSVWAMESFACPRCSIQHVVDVTAGTWSHTCVEQHYDEDGEPFDRPHCAMCGVGFSPPMKLQDFYVSGQTSILLELGALYEIPVTPDRCGVLEFKCASRPELNGRYMLQEYKSPGIAKLVSCPT